jgi:hypothetical protein
MAFIEDYDDVKYKELNKFMTDFSGIEDFPHCSCSDRYVAIVNEEFTHMKREYCIYDVEYICMNCEQSWIKRMNLRCYYNEFKLTQMPTLLIDREEEE